jgi:Clr5 domain
VQTTCFELVSDEQQALEEIMQHMRDVYSFAPSKRAFQTQFRRWGLCQIRISLGWSSCDLGFPSKQNPAHRNMDLVARVKELWEKNTTQRDMLRILNEEGYGIKERELMRVRAKNRWLLRVPNGMKAAIRTEDLPSTESVPHIEGAYSNPQPQAAPAPDSKAVSPPLSPQVLAKRKERLDKLQAESDQRWQEKKRRRRTRGWAGLPADPPGPPRFPSETTLDESKTFLSLDIALYREVREHFARVCDDSGIIKKTIAGPEKWQQAKDRLIRENTHLQKVFWVENTHLDAKALALDVVCTDVTKRMRTMERRMTIAEAKNTLGINPEESRRMRNAFYSTLKADHFTSKLEAGNEHWKELKEQWMQGQPLLLSILSPGDADPEHATKVKAVEVLCRDVMKRLRDDQTKRDPNKIDRDEVQLPTEQSSPKKGGHKTSTGIASGVGKGISRLASKALASTPMVTSNISDMQIDPSLLQAANDPSFAADHQHFGNSLPDYMPASETDSPAAPVAVYLRPHPKSQMYRTAKVWLGTLSTRTVAELRELLASKWPNASIVRVDGIKKGAGGQEISYLIEEDDELDAYLSHVQDRKATFVAWMNRP